MYDIIEKQTDSLFGFVGFHLVNGELLPLRQTERRECIFSSMLNFAWPQHTTGSLSQCEFTEVVLVCKRLKGPAMNERQMQNQIYSYFNHEMKNKKKKKRDTPQPT